MLDIRPRSENDGLNVKGDIVDRMARTVLRRRWQLLGALLLCVAVPGLVRWGLDFLTDPVGTDVNTVMGALVAVIAGFFTMRRFGEYPGIQYGGSVIFAFTAAFGLTAAFFLATRLEYSRYVMFSSYLLSMAWFVAMHLLHKRYIRPVLAVVPGGNALAMVGMFGATWRLLDAPRLDRHVSAVVADLRHDHPEDWDRFLADTALAGIPVYHTKQLAESLTGKVAIEHLSENTFGSLLPDMAYLKVKQAADWLIAVLALPFFLLVFLVVGPLTILSSGWPVFFLQERVGYGGRIFKVWKFRTMRPAPLGDARDEDGPDSAVRVRREVMVRRHLDRCSDGFCR